MVVMICSHCLGRMTGAALQMCLLDGKRRARSKETSCLPLEPPGVNTCSVMSDMWSNLVRHCMPEVWKQPPAWISSLDEFCMQQNATLSLSQSHLSCLGQCHVAVLMYISTARQGLQLQTRFWTT